jgi:hypothetical protein
MARPLSANQRHWLLDNPCVKATRGNASRRAVMQTLSGEQRARPLAAASAAAMTGDGPPRPGHQDGFPLRISLLRRRPPATPFVFVNMQTCRVIPKPKNLATLLFAACTQEIADGNHHYGHAVCVLVSNETIAAFAGAIREDRACFPNWAEQGGKIIED